MKWWFEFGDIDMAYQFYFQESAPELSVGRLFGPYDSFKEAREELLIRLRFMKSETVGAIELVKAERASKYRV